MTQSVETIASAAKEVHKGFLALVEPHRSALWRYCCSLTASYWDGEDLFQETMTRAFATLTQTWQPISPRAYLFRIATNAWTDSLRKRNVEIDTYAVTEDVPADEPRTDPDDVRHAMEVLVGVLPPRQTAVLLLMDVYGFTAPEVAGMVRCTVGAVYAALQRARSKLRTHGSRLPNSDSSPAAKKGKAHLHLQAPVSAVDPKLIDQLVDALQTGNRDALLELMSDSVQTDAAPGFQEFSKEETGEGSGQYLPANLRVEYQTLWGRTVRVVMIESAEGHLLHDISYQEWDNGKIVLHKSYYFCREFMLAAGKELGVPVQLSKPPGIQWADTSVG